MKIALLLLFAGCATPSYSNYARSSYPLPPEPAAEKYLDRPDLQREVRPPSFPQEPAPTPRP
jgi:hypothetical protein